MWRTPPARAPNRRGDGGAPLRVRQVFGWSSGKDWVSTKLNAGLSPALRMNLARSWLRVPPDEELVSMPASERLYYADSFLRNFTATVTDVRELSRNDGESVWQLAMDRTAFYPTSGGQRYDTGVLRATSRGGASLDVAVESVEEDENGEVWHFVRKPLAAGTMVEAEIDWERRLDHMQQHTGQHLLSAVFLREVGAATVSFHLGETLSTIDLATGPLAAHTLERIERLANEIIAEDRPVRAQLVERAEAEAMLAAGELRKLPDRAGAIRILEIAD